MSELRRDFVPDDLRSTIAMAGIDQVISVQARQSVDETTWLLALAAKEPFIAGVVGWLPLVEADFESQLEAFGSNKKLKGFRHVLQAEPDSDFMLREDFNRGIAALGRQGLSYDLLILERQLTETMKLVDLHPEQVFILDHIAKPRIKDGELQPWLSQMKELARRPNVWCKLSGVVTEDDYKGWTEASIRPYLDGALEAFGSRRLMFGSDWPVCLVATGYSEWVSLLEEYTQRLSLDEQEAFWAGNASEAYRLK